MAGAPQLLVSWSSGKDCAWTLHVLRQQAQYEIVGLVTTFNEAADRVAMHAVRRELVEAQAEAAGLPLWPVPLPFPCSNDEYEARMRRLIERARAGGVTHMAFGDLFLDDVRAYRERMLLGTGIKPVFPIFGEAGSTRDLAKQMLRAGVRATLTCVDPKQLSPTYLGRTWDTQLLAELPGTVDACGERGEFHTFCHSGPMFSRPIPVLLGDRVERDGFHFIDVVPAAPAGTA